MGAVRPGRDRLVAGVVYLGGYDFAVHAHDAAIRRERWSYDTVYIVHSTPAVADETVYIGCHDDRLYAIDAATGA